MFRFAFRFRFRKAKFSFPSCLYSEFPFLRSERACSRYYSGFPFSVGNVLLNNLISFVSSIFPMKKLCNGRSLYSFHQIFNRSLQWPLGTFVVFEKGNTKRIYGCCAGIEKSVHLWYPGDKHRYRSHRNKWI